MSARLIPPSTELTQPYWDATRQGKLVVQQCSDCSHRLFPPAARCSECGSAQLAWAPLSGRGVVYTYTVTHRAPHPVLAEQCPLVIAVVELEEGPRMISNVIGCDPSAVEIGMPVQVAFEPVDDSDMVLPVFKPA
jgi:uncharacterized OB-fold protein